GLGSHEKAPESRKRYSEIFRSLDAIEISLGNAYVGTVEMLMGDAESSEGTEPSPARELLPLSETFSKSKPSSERQVQPDLTAQEADEMLSRCEGGIEAALD
ncbi:GEM-interacting protein, partial [Colius striatus]